MLNPFFSGDQTAALGTAAVHVRRPVWQQPLLQQSAATRRQLACKGKKNSTQCLPRHRLMEDGERTHADGRLLDLLQGSAHGAAAARGGVARRRPGAASRGGHARGGDHGTEAARGGGGRAAMARRRGPVGAPAAGARGGMVGWSTEG